MVLHDGKAWSYRENEVTDRKGKAYTEAIFLDITKKYEEKINLTKQTEQLKEIAKEMIKEKMSLEVISKITKISKEELQEIKKEI